MIRFEKVFSPQGYTSPNRLCQLQTGVHGLAFKGEHAKDAFVEATTRFLPNEAFQRFNAKSKFAKCQRALGRHRATTEALSVFGQ
jgi:hypothetical protein